MTNKEPFIEHGDQAPELLFVTYEFPYGNSETFIESEIAYLAERFSTVWVFPSRAVWSKHWLNTVKGSARALPPGCKLVAAENIKSSYLDIGWFCFVLLLKLDFNSLIRFPHLGFYKSVWRDVVKAALLGGPLKGFLNKSSRSMLSYSYWKSPAATVLALFREMKALPLAVTRCHGGDLYNDRLTYPCRPHDKYVSRQIDYLFPVSDHGAKYLASNGFSAEKICASRLGVGSVSNPTAASQDGVFRIVSCSNLIPLKRVSMIAHALERLDFPFSWVHFGDGVERENIEMIASRFRSTGNAVFFGRVPNSVVLRYYQENQVDVFINVSESEGVPVSIMEALSAGIPCVATDVGGVQEILDDSCGILLSPDIDSVQLGKIISTIQIEHDEWARKRVGAFARGKERCNARANYQQFSRFLAEKASAIDIKPVGF